MRVPVVTKKAKFCNGLVFSAMGKSGFLPVLPVLRHARVVGEAVFIALSRAPSQTRATRHVAVQGGAGSA